MYSKLPYKPTPYSEYLTGAVMRVVGQGGGWTAEQLAKETGLKLTHNFRKRLHQLVSENRLESVPCYRDSDGRMIVIYAKMLEGGQEQTCDDIPF